MGIVFQEVLDIGHGVTRKVLTQRIDRTMNAPIRMSGRLAGFGRNMEARMAALHRQRVGRLSLDRRGMPPTDCLDGLRGLAAVCVALVFHYRHFFDISTQPAPWFFDNPVFIPVLHYGHLSVDLFFVISGFIMTLVYFEDIRDGRVTGGRFAVLRFSRLWPLHAVMTIAAGVLGYGYFLTFGTASIPGVVADDPYHLMLNLLLMQRIGLQFSHSFNFVSWSISTEIVCYFVFFAVCIRGRWFELLSGFLFLLGIFLMFNRVNTLFFDVDTGRGFLGFFAGALICRAFQCGYRRPMAIGAWCFIVYYPLSLMLPTPPGGAMAATQIGIPLTLQTVVFPALLVVSLTTPVLRYVLSRAPFAWLGRLSYSIYLTHLSVQYAVFLTFRSLGEAVPYDRFRFWAGYAGLVLALSVATYRFIERPAQAWLRSMWDDRGRLRGTAYVPAGYAGRDEAVAVADVPPTMVQSARR